MAESRARIQYFFRNHQVPEDRWKDVTYATFVCELKPKKAEVHHTQLTVGGDKVHYSGDVGTPTADLTLVKMHINSVVSTRGAQYMTLDVKNFYLNTPMVKYEYVRIKVDDISDKIIVEYNLHDKVSNDGHIYVKIQKGMYGLPQAGILAQELLENEKIRPWARGLRVLRLKTIGRGWGGHPWWAQPLFVMIK